MQKIIECECGVTLEGASESEVVRLADEHVRAAHGMTLDGDVFVAKVRPKPS